MILFKYIVCLQCMLAVTSSKVLHKVLASTESSFHLLQDELEGALISCNSQVENLEKEVEEQRRYYQ